jgi:hypothetical protein
VSAKVVDFLKVCVLLVSTGDKINKVLPAGTRTEKELVGLQDHSACSRNLSQPISSPVCKMSTVLLCIVLKMKGDTEIRNLAGKYSIPSNNCWHLEISGFCLKSFQPSSLSEVDWPPAYLRLRDLTFTSKTREITSKWGVSKPLPSHSQTLSTCRQTELNYLINDDT